MYSGIHSELTGRIVGCAVEVHRHWGASLVESVYEAALCQEMQLQGLPFNRQVIVTLEYKGATISHHRLDVVVDDRVVVEVKSVNRLDAIFTAQVLTYLRVTGLRVGLILYFNSVVMRDGVRRIIL